jgi:hypothetical protein
MIRKRGYVALLDVLGFSERVARDAELGGLDRYIATVLAVSEPYHSLRVILFSDTVVLYSLDDSEAAYTDITAVTSRLSFALLMQEVPRRGAIAYGSFSRSEYERNCTVIAGPPIIEAHYYEARLQWIGVMLAPSVLRQVPDLSSRTAVSGQREAENPDAYVARVTRAAQVQRCSRIPFESPGVPLGFLEGYAVVPLSAEADGPEALRQCMSDSLAKLQWLKQLAPEPRSQAKYEHSIAWLRPLPRLDREHAVERSGR